jgi:polyhydroxybutyrate depolymerase
LSRCAGKEADLRGSRVVVAGAVAFVLAGCPSEREHPRVPPPGNAVHSTIGGREVSHRNIVVSDETRDVLVSAPSGNKLPLVVVLHGGGMTPDAMRAYADLERLARGPAVFAYPAARVRNVWQGEYALHWDATVDLAFFDAMLDDLSHAFSIDRSRVYVFGLSSGAYFANELGCARSKSIAAIAAIEGGGPYGECEGSVDAFIAHDKNDPVVPVSEGKASIEHWQKAKPKRFDSQLTDIGVHALAPGIRERALRFFAL